MGEVRDGVGWFKEEFSGATGEPNLSVSEQMVIEEEPTLTVATIIGVTVIMLIAIAMVFVLGVLIDCRQQRVIEQRFEETKRMKNQRRVNTHPEEDRSSIANNMEGPDISLPPAEMLRNIP